VCSSDLIVIRKTLIASARGLSASGLHTRTAFSSATAFSGNDMIKVMILLYLPVPALNVTAGQLAPRSQAALRLVIVGPVNLGSASHV
jgi:hypothetical protein